MLFVRCYCRLRDHVQLVLEILILASLRDVPMVEVLFGRFPPFGFLGMMSVVPMMFVRCYCRLRDHVQLVLEILILASLLFRGLQFALALALALVLALALALTLALAFLCTGGLLRLVLEILILASLRDVDVRTMPMVEVLFGRFP